MKIFECKNCACAVYFENTICSNCNHLLGYNPAMDSMVTLQKNEDQTFKDLQTNQAYKFCKNAALDSCNWLISSQNHDDYCTACKLNRIIPDLSDPVHLERWQEIELGKKRLIYSLLKWQLPFTFFNGHETLNLTFDFKATTEAEKVLTGHAKGLITINIEEADDVERELAKRNLDEVYRTILGHFRHEVGHYYWDVFILHDTKLLANFRALFGDETYDYQAALDQHYKNGAPYNWQENYISSYATMHPWEDWAECWAHYFHIVDTLETAYSSGLHISPPIANGLFKTNLDFQPYFEPDFSKIMNNWMSISIILNNLNRSMGHDDLYPFVVNDAVEKKLTFIHQVIHEHMKQCIA